MGKTGDKTTTFSFFCFALTRLCGEKALGSCFLGNCSCRHWSHNRRDRRLVFYSVCFLSSLAQNLNNLLLVDFVNRFFAAAVSFVGFLAACRFADPPKASDSNTTPTVSLELTASPSSDESDTAALVSTSGSVTPVPVEDFGGKKQQTRSLSVFRILAIASGTVFGSTASVVFFLNLFFINIGTNVVEGLVRTATFSNTQMSRFLIFCQVFMFFQNDLGASSSVLGEFTQHTVCTFVALSPPFEYHFLQVGV